MAGDGLVLQADNFNIRLAPLNYQTFMRWMTKRGISEQLLANPEMRGYLGSFAVFHLILHNQGEDNLIFNPEQVMLRNAMGPVGFQVSLADILRSPLGHSEPELEKLATLFMQKTFELTPGQRLGRVIAFRPISKKFPSKITFAINRMYYGIENVTIQCQFKLRYP